MAYEAKDFSGLLGIDGFSDTMLKNHFALYQGYVANTNKLADALKNAEPGTPEYAELKRRFGWEFNGMRLHELYFGGLKKSDKSVAIDSGLLSKIAEDFGSYENWEKDFKATGAMRGMGWVVLYYDLTGKRLFNAWINEHDSGHLSSCVPLLVMDVFEHAYMLDYGLKRDEYINAYFKAIDWEAVNSLVASKIGL